MTALDEVVLTASEHETRALAARLAARLFPLAPVFVRLEGPLGSGKSAFARGFLLEWSRLAGEPITDTIASPTYNIARVYGTKHAAAHLDLYRIKSFEELEQLGYEHYFYEQSCCLVEWLEQVPALLSQMPAGAVEITLEILEAGEGNSSTRRIRVKSQREISLAP